MARTDTLPHFLKDVADAIREKKGSEDTIQASDFDTEIENLPSGGGAKQLPYIDSEAQTFIEYSGVTTQIPNIGKTQKNLVIKGLTKKGLCFGFARSDYTLSENLELIAETEWFTYDNSNQKVFIAWCNNLQEYMSLTQQTYGRMGGGTIFLKDGKKPTNTILNTIIDTGASSYTINPTNNMCIYIVSSVYNFNYPTQSSAYSDFSYVYAGDRLAIYVSIDDKPKNILLSNYPGCAILGVEIEYEAE